MKEERLEFIIMAVAAGLIFGTVIVMSLVYGIHDTASYTF
mgnify:CR=1 FL=1